jgi:hypothetical protein
VRVGNEISCCGWCLWGWGRAEEVGRRGRAENGDFLMCLTSSGSEATEDGGHESN